MSGVRSTDGPFCLAFRRVPERTSTTVLVLGGAPQRSPDVFTMTGSQCFKILFACFCFCFWFFFFYSNSEEEMASQLMRYLSLVKLSGQKIVPNCCDVFGRHSVGEFGHSLDC